MTWEQKMKEATWDMARGRFELPKQKPRFKYVSFDRTQGCIGQPHWYSIPGQAFYYVTKAGTFRLLKRIPNGRQ